jgi:hypothetical protein
LLCNDLIEPHYPPEVQAVLDAAKEWACDDGIICGSTDAKLLNAVRSLEEMENKK